ncbi:MAG: hypothetical protein KDA24_24140 [Deltaproteobacteria bacterium]|nr:hypothetical protein [Deltaproteobacteria bacterium]
MRPILQLLARFASFRVLLPLLVLLGGSGVWLHEGPRFQNLTWGMTEMLHVQFGWAGLVLFLAYQTHHLVTKWGSFTDRHRIEGLVLAVCTVAVFGTGVWLVLPISGGPPGWVRPVHWFGTFGMVGLTLLHTVGGLRRWLAKQRGIVFPRRSE